jgi:antitoxin VapB
MKPARAKLFQNGGSQAVRLPRQCRFPEGETEVVVTRIGRKVILEPLNDWPESFLGSLGSLTETVERPKRVAVSKLRDPFE